VIKEVDIFGIYVAPVAANAFWTVVIFFLLRIWFDRVRIQRWVWHRPLFDAAVFVIILSIIGLIF
jgi:hypothetical protein